MAFIVDPQIRDMFLGSHQMLTRVIGLRENQSLGDIPVRDVNVFATYGTRGGRDATLLVDRNVVNEGLLDPTTDEVIILTGIKGVVEVPIFTGRVDAQNDTSPGSVEVPLLSRGAEAIRAEFEVPWAAKPPLISTMEMTRLIQDVNASWAVETSRALEKPIPANLVWEYDRGGALDQIAQGASHIWQPDRVGGFTIYENPFAIGPTLAAQSVVTLRDGVDGCLAQVSAAKSREGLYNSITLVVERVNNTEPLRVTVRDADPSSPTRWGGPFGKANRVVKNQNPLDLVSATQLATRILRQSLALQRSWRITIPHMPLLDPGDVFSLWYQDVVFALVAESINYSGSAQDMTVISGRELTGNTLEVIT